MDFALKWRSRCSGPQSLLSWATSLAALAVAVAVELDVPAACFATCGFARGSTRRHLPHPVAETLSSCTGCAFLPAPAPFGVPPQPPRRVVASPGPFSLSQLFATLAAGRRPSARSAEVRQLQYSDCDDSAPARSGRSGAGKCTRTARGPDAALEDGAPLRASPRATAGHGWEGRVAETIVSRALLAHAPGDGVPAPAPRAGAPRG